MNDERMGVYAASRLTAGLRAGSPGLIFREQRGGDTGLNAHLEVVEEYPKMGKLVGLQVRTVWDGLDAAAAFPFRQSAAAERVERTARGYVCRGEMAHLAYWLQHSLPVLVMVYEPDKDQLLWETVSPDRLEIAERYWELLVPADQVYGPEAAQKIADLPCYSPYLARLAVDKPWMMEIEAGHDLLVELDEWLNQPSERGSLRLSVLDNSFEGSESALVSGNLQAATLQAAVYEWPFETNPDMPHVFRLASLFPWAHIAVDEPFYRGKGAFSEDSVGVTPWTVEAGEIARFRLRLTLNELGRAFLTAERFIRRGDFPAAQTPASFGEDYEKGIKFRLYQRQRNAAQ